MGKPREGEKISSMGWDARRSVKTTSSTAENLSLGEVCVLQV
jgi:hypothetical protein